ncbi:TP53-binding protein 1 [Anabrus simplex]|uniref:TP53-binding protein 1 n=1 Tax=Anabrus simplex TaxID=316456 RepID=UPI0035A33034
MESEAVKEPSMSSIDRNQSNHDSSSVDDKKDLGETVSSSSGNSNGDNEAGSEMTQEVVPKNVTAESSDEKKSDKTLENSESLDKQKVSPQNNETLAEDNNDANNTSDETFCSNESSSVIIEDKDVQVISESDGEEDQGPQADDPRSSGLSEATTVDIAEIGEPRSPDDMFASQPPDEPTTIQDTQDVVGSMDCNDFIPSSQSLESNSHHAEAESSKPDQQDDGCSPLSRKRKLETVDEVNKKLPRIEEENVTSGKSLSEDTHKQAETVCEPSSNEVTSSKQESEINPGENSSVEEVKPAESTNKSIYPEQHVTGMERNEKSENELHSGDSVNVTKTTEPEIVELTNMNKLSKKDYSRKQARESLEIVFMSPTVSCSQESLDVDTQISPLRDDGQIKCLRGLSSIVEDRKCEDEEEKNFHLHLSMQTSQKESNLKKKGDTTPSCPAKTSSEISGSDESTWNSHNSMSCSRNHEKSSNSSDRACVENGPQTCTEVLTVEDEDNDLQILSLEQTKQVENKCDSVGITSSEHTLSEGLSPTSNDIAVIHDGRSISNTTLDKQEVSSHCDSVPSFGRQKEHVVSIASDSNCLPSSVGDKGTAGKRKRDSSKSSDVIRIGSDSEGEDHAGPVVVKKSREHGTPEDVAHFQQIAKDKRMSTPYEGSARLSVNASISSIEMECLKEVSPPTKEKCTISKQEHSADIIGQSVELEKKIHLECRVKVKFNSQNQEILSWEVAQWDITDDLVPSSTQGVPDISPGALADVSKSSSPSSVTSGGLFPLHSRHRISTSTSSSGGTSVTSYSGVSRTRSSLESVQFLKPPVRSLKDKSLSLESSLGKLPCAFPGRLKERDLEERIERHLQQCVNDGEIRGKPGHELSDISPRNGFNQVEKEKSFAYKSRSRTVVEKSEDQVMEENKNISSSEEKKSKEKKMALDITPKSTKKSHLKPARAARNAPRSSGSRVAKQIKDDIGGKQASKDKANESNDKSTPQKRGRASKKGNSTAKKSGSGDTKPVSSDTPKRSKKSDEIEPATQQPLISRRGKNDTDDSVVSGSSSESEVTLDWSIESCKTKLVAGAPAFARWTDKRYYSAKIKENVKDDRWIVEFDDGNVKTLKEEFIIPVNILTKGQIVFAPVEDEFDEGIIKKFKMKNKEVHYGIEMEGGEIVYVPPSKLFMTEDQARILQEDVAPKQTPSTPKSTSVSVDNIVEGKRSRSNRTIVRTVEGPGVSGISKVAPKRPSRADPGHDISRSSSVSDITDKESASAFEEVGGVEPEVYSSPDCTYLLNNRGKGPGRVKGKGRSTTKRFASSNQSNNKTENPDLIESLGPIPPEGSKIFSGMHFLLTYAGTGSIPYPSGGSEESGWETADAGDSRRFVKSRLKSQLEAGGGKVYEHFKDVPDDVYSSCYLIADRPTETAKYILCLASGIKIVDYQWVITKCEGKIGVRYDESMLPTGWSVEDKKFVEFDLKTRKKKPLNGIKVGLVNDSKQFLEFWDRVLVAIGAKVLKISSDRDKELKSVKVIVTDICCPPEVQDRAREWNIPMVSTSWVKQCLIRWEFRPYDGHPSYRYDYCPLD